MVAHGPPQAMQNRGVSVQYVGPNRIRLYRPVRIHSTPLPFSGLPVEWPQESCRGFSFYRTPKSIRLDRVLAQAPSYHEVNTNVIVLPATTRSSPFPPTWC